MACWFSYDKPTLTVFVFLSWLWVPCGQGQFLMLPGIGGGGTKCAECPGGQEPGGWSSEPVLGRGWGLGIGENCVPYCGVSLPPSVQSQVADGTLVGKHVGMTWFSLNETRSGSYRTVTFSSPPDTALLGNGEWLDSVATSWLCSLTAETLPSPHPPTGHPQPLPLTALCLLRRKA